MRFLSAISTLPDADAAVGDVLRSLEQQDRLNADAAFVFFTAHHNPEAERLVERLWLELDPQCMVGCSGDGVIGGDLEIERQPGLAVLIGQMPQVRLHPFHIAGELDWRHVLTDDAELAERLGYGPLSRGLVGFGDPFSTPTGQFLKADSACPQAPLIGGMASSGRQAGENLLVRNDQVFDEGFVGVTLSGPLTVEPVVSQGCRPIGKPMLITKSHDNIIEQLGGRPALEMLRQTVNGIGPQEESLLANGLFLGRAISEYRDTFGRGDFLVRNVIGVNEEARAIGVADYVRTGQTVQFHVRDAATAGEDLQALLSAQQQQGEPAAGALLFSCNGRGTRLFNTACHDIGQTRKAMPQTPAAGFFAAGEFGPVGGRNFIHGHTASLALFRPAGTPG